MPNFFCYASVSLICRHQRHVMTNEMGLEHIMQYMDCLTGLHEIHDAIEGGIKTHSEICRFHALQNAQLNVQPRIFQSHVQRSVIADADELDSKVTSSDRMCLP